MVELATAGTWKVTEVVNEPTKNKTKRTKNEENEWLEKIILDEPLNGDTDTLDQIVDEPCDTLDKPVDLTVDPSEKLVADDECFNEVSQISSWTRIRQPEMWNDNNRQRRDLMSLCKTNLIPSTYHDFYKTLTTTANVAQSPDDEEED